MPAASSFAHYLRASLTVALLSSFAPLAIAAEFHACPDASTSPELEATECALVEAPLDPLHANDVATVDLFVRRFPAAHASRGTVWLVSGGPGESGATFHPFIATLKKAFPDFDLVVPDHRGTGFSSRICPVEEAVDSPGGTALAGAEWATCWTAANASPDRTKAFSITNAAHDLVWLMTHPRRAGRTYLVAVSYGTQLALRALQFDHPPIAGVILDSLVPRESTTRWDLSHRSQIVDDVGRTVLRRCDDDAACAARFGGSATKVYARLVARSDPAVVDRVPGRNLELFFGSVLDVPAVRGRIPDLIDDLSTGRDAALSAVLRELNEVATSLGRYPQSPLAIPLVSVISASENNARPGLTAATVKAEQASLLFASPLPGLLVDPGLPLYRRDETFDRLPVHLPPTLVLQGTLDPKTPFEGAAEQVARLRAIGPITFLPVKDAPHFVLFAAPDCFVDAVRRFRTGGHGDVAHCSNPS